MLKDEILERVNKRYRAKKMENNPYKAPEELPDGVKSDQIKAVIEVFAEILEELGMNQTEMKRVKEESEVTSD